MTISVLYYSRVSFISSTPKREAFKVEIQEIITEGGYSLDNVYNADETGLYVKSLPKRTLVLVEEKQAPRYKEWKERVTIMNCSNATGTHKVPLLLIRKSGRLRCFKNVVQLPVVYREQKSAWMDSMTLIFVHLFHSHLQL